MSDGWTDGKGRHLINFLVICPKGSVFLKSVDASKTTNDAMFIANLVDEVIKDVGAENVIQFVTDNGSNFKAAGNIIHQRYPNIFWTPCAAHCVNLILEELGDKLPQIKRSVARGKRLVAYIYGHVQVLSMMRKMTGNKELHRSTKTRFATQYYTLKSLHEQKTPLQMLFVSNKWIDSKFSKEITGKNDVRIVTSRRFWDDIVFAVNVLGPLVKVVRLVDTKRKPTMGYIYEKMRKARERLESNFTGDSSWGIIKEVVDRRWKQQLNHPLHEAAYYLNPRYFYNITAEEMDSVQTILQLRKVFTRQWRYLYLVKKIVIRPSLNC